MASIYHPQLNSLDVKLFGGQEKCARYGGGGRRRQVETNLHDDVSENGRRGIPSCKKNVDLPSFVVHDLLGWIARDEKF